MYVRNASLQLDTFISFHETAAGMGPHAPPAAADGPNGTPQAGRKQEVAVGPLQPRALASGMQSWPRPPFALILNTSFPLSIARAPRIPRGRAAGAGRGGGLSCAPPAGGGRWPRPARALLSLTCMTQATHRAAAPMYACRASAKWRARDPRACGIYLSCEVGLGRIKVDGCEGVC